MPNATIWRITKAFTFCCSKIRSMNSLHCALDSRLQFFFFNKLNFVSMRIPLFNENKLNRLLLMFNFWSQHRIDVLKLSANLWTGRLYKFSNWYSLSKFFSVDLPANCELFTAQFSLFIKYYSTLKMSCSFMHWYVFNNNMWAVKLYFFCW